MFGSVYNFSRCIYTVNSKGSIGLSNDGAIILEVKVAANMARFEVQQCWNFFVTRTQWCVVEVAHAISSCLLVIDHTYIYHCPIIDHLLHIIQVHMITPGPPNIYHVTACKISLNSREL